MIARIQRNPGASGAWREGRFRQAIEAETVGYWSVGAWRCGLSRQAMVAVNVGSEALGTWRYATPARSGSWQRLVARVPRQAILLPQLGVVDFIDVIYKAFSDALKVDCWYSLSCGSERIP